MSEKIELKMGSEFTIEGKDYVVVGYNVNTNLEGYSISISAWSPLYVMEQQLKREQIAEVVTGTQKHLRHVEKEIEDGS